MENRCTPVRVALPLVLAAAALCACEAITRQAWIEVTAPNESDALIALSPPDVEARATARVRYQASDEIEEYAIYDGAAGKAELLFVTTMDDRYALENGFNIEQALQLFAYSKDRAQGLGASESAWAGTVEVFYRRFEIADEARACLGLEADWDVVDDPETRPARLVVGYYCSAPNNSLDQARMKAIVEGLGIRRPADTRPLQTPPEAREGLLRLARGDGASASRGVPGFPLDLARRYQEERNTDVRPL